MFYSLTFEREKRGEEGFIPRFLVTKAASASFLGPMFRVFSAGGHTAWVMMLATTTVHHSPRDAQHLCRKSYLGKARIRLEIVGKWASHQSPPLRVRASAAWDSRGANEGE